MTSNPKVSIIIPVYNGSNYLQQAIDSALEQTCQDREVIVVNDGSNDGGKTEAIAKSYGDKIRYFYKENGGVASALNLGINNMRGEWFAWLSHDDIFAPNRIEEDLIFLEKNPGAKVVYCKIKSIDSQGEVIGEVHYPSQPMTDLLKALMFLDMCTMTIHKSCFDKTGLFNELKRTTQDVDMTLRLARVSPFYLNSNSVTYKREHLNRGTYTLSEVHKKEVLDFCHFIHNEFSLSDFFPDLDSDEKTARAWFCMGDLYRSYGVAHYSEECYRLAIRSYKNPLRRSIKMFDFTARKIENPLLGKLLNLLYFFYKKGRGKSY